MIKKIFVACLLLVMTTVCLATERIELYIGEIKILELAGIERIAVGNPAIVSNSMLNNGQLILFAEADGSTNVHIWFSNGSAKSKAKCKKQQPKQTSFFGKIVSHGFTNRKQT